AAALAPASLAVAFQVQAAAVGGPHPCFPDPPAFVHHEAIGESVIRTVIGADDHPLRDGPGSVGANVEMFQPLFEPVPRRPADGAAREGMEGTHPRTTTI